MQVQIYSPHPALQDYVSNILTINAVLPEGISEVVNPYPPSPFQSLIFYCNDPISMGRSGSGLFDSQPLALLTGPQLSRVDVKVHRQLRSIRFDFLPGALYRLIGVPMFELQDGGFDAMDFFGSEMKTLNEQVRNTPDLEMAKRLVEEFLLKRVSGLRGLLPFDAAMRGMLMAEGNISVDKAAALACRSATRWM